MTSNDMLQMLAFIVNGAKKMLNIMKNVLLLFWKININYIYWIIYPLFGTIFGSSWNWNLMNCAIKVLCHVQNTCWMGLFSRLKKFECIFCCSNLHQMSTNVLWTLIYFIRKATCVNPFRCTYIDLLKDVVDSIF